MQTILLTSDNPADELETIADDAGLDINPADALTDMDEHDDFYVQTLPGVGIVWSRETTEPVLQGDPDTVLMSTQSVEHIRNTSNSAGSIDDGDADILGSDDDDGPAAGDRHHGRPPLGYDVKDGHLVTSGNYPKVRRVLEKVVDGDLSKRQAAAALDTSHRTINRSINTRPERYGLDP
jgi:hypothetical protein